MLSHSPGRSAKPKQNTYRQSANRATRNVPSHTSSPAYSVHVHWIYLQPTSAAIPPCRNLSPHRVRIDTILPVSQDPPVSQASASEQASRRASAAPLELAHDLSATNLLPIYHSTRSSQELRSIPVCSPVSPQHLQIAIRYSVPPRTECLLAVSVSSPV